jgi:hypothetical protein
MEQQTAAARFCASASGDASGSANQRITATANTQRDIAQNRETDS